MSSVHSKGDEAPVSVEATEKSSSLLYVDTSDLPVSLDSRLPPRAPTLSTMSHTPQAQMSVSPRASPGAVASGGSGRPSLKERLAAMRASSRAEAAARRLSRKEPGRAPSTTNTNDMAVQTNQFQYKNTLESQQENSPQPQSEVSSHLPSPEQLALPAATSNTIGTIPLQPHVNETLGQSSIITPKSRDETPLQIIPSVTPIESRIETQPLEVPLEVPLPVRVSQLDAHTPNHPSKLSFHEEMASISQVTNSLHPVDFGTMEYAVPLAMSTRVRDQYLAVMNVNGSIIHSIEHKAPDQISSEALDEVNAMLARLNRVSTHTDLDDPSTAHQKDATVEDLAEWAKVNSEKFNFLKCLLVDWALDDQVHFAIIARAGRLLDIVEDFLKGIQVAYHRPDTLVRSDPGTTKGRIEVSLIASGIEGSSVLPKAADLVVALDGSFDAQDTQVETLRSHMTNVGQLAPVVHLLVYKSAEHIEKCISRALDPIERARRIVSCLTQVGDEVGHLLDDQLSTVHVAQEVAFMTKQWEGRDYYWDSLPKIGPIEGIVSIEYSGDLGASTNMDTHPNSERRLIASTGALKRILVCQFPRHVSLERLQLTFLGFGGIFSARQTSENDTWC